MKNDVDQLASASQPNGEMGPGMSSQSSYGTTATSTRYQPQQPSSTNPASASNTQPQH